MIYDVVIAEHPLNHSWEFIINFGELIVKGKARVKGLISLLDVKSGAFSLSD